MGSPSRGSEGGVPRTPVRFSKTQYKLQLYGKIFQFLIKFNENYTIFQKIVKIYSNFHESLAKNVLM